MKEKTVKKATTAVEEAVVEAMPTEAVKDTEVKAEEKAPAAKETKTTKTVAKTKTATKTKTAKAAVKTEEKAPAKKTTAKKATAKKAEIMANVTLQFDGKAYTEKELTIIAKDVWKYDLGRDEAEIKTIELYVKPEEGVCYYVINSEVTGSFRV
ncbi:MAG: DNA-binding protein [Lachnospiraceae bacterium]|nr:DNA-binding protein [Lachnospiraceae bacterium]